MHAILLPIDFSDSTDRAINVVAEMGSRLDAEVWVLHASQAAPDDPKQGRSTMTPKVDEVVQRLEAEDCKAHALLVFGSPIACILEQIDAKEPDLVVMGSHGHTALHDLIVGGVTHSVLRSGKCPVLIVPAPRPTWEPSPADIEAMDWDAYGFPFN